MRLVLPHLISIVCLWKFDPCYYALKDACYLSVIFFVLAGQSLCYAFINFKDARDASIAVDRLNGIVVGNKKIKVTKGKKSKIISRQTKYGKYNLS